MKTIVNLKLPIKTVSESNSTAHWTKKSKLHKVQKGWIKAAFNEYKLKIPLPCHVILTRIAPRALDVGDNLPNSLKYIRDAISELITGETKAGRADGDERISWEYSQEKGLVREYGVKIEIKEIICL